jgi:serine/threonine-protein kinase
MKTIDDIRAHLRRYAALYPEFVLAGAFLEKDGELVLIQASLVGVGPWTPWRPQPPILPGPLKFKWWALSRDAALSLLQNPAATLALGNDVIRFEADPVTNWESAGGGGVSGLYYLPDAFKGFRGYTVHFNLTGAMHDFAPHPLVLSTERELNRLNFDLSSLEEAAKRCGVRFSSTPSADRRQLLVILPLPFRFEKECVHPDKPVVALEIAAAVDRAQGGIRHQGPDRVWYIYLSDSRWIESAIRPGLVRLEVTLTEPLTPGRDLALRWDGEDILGMKVHNVLMEKLIRAGSLDWDDSSNDLDEAETNSSRNTVPTAVIEVVGQILGEHYYHHETLHTLFAEHGAPGDPPNGTCVAKSKEWLRRANSDSAVDAFEVLGGVLRDFMDLDPGGEQQQRVHRILNKHHLAYRAGGLIVDASLRTVRLNRGEWRYDPLKQLGSTGGFGSVYSGLDSKDREIAVKVLRVSAAEAGHREIRVADELIGKDYQHLVPVLDAGMDAAGTYYVVMAKAERTLDDLLGEVGAVEEKEAVRILIDITAGLTELAGLVHRDLKPGNVLFHEGRWKIADFGIARFVEESTSVNTLKDAMTWPYAAPEQWRLETVTKATDVYALGCIAVELLNGAAPFSGPDHEDYRRQHLNDAPPDISCSPRLATLISMCLRKSPESRPTLKSVRAQLDSALKSAAGSGGALVAAGAAVAKEQASREREDLKARDETAYRRQIASEALAALKTMMDDLFEAIVADAPSSQRSERSIRLGSGKIHYEIAFPFIGRERFKESGWDVASGAYVQVSQERPQYPNRSANFWFAKAPNEEGFRWWEISYMMPTSASRRPEPFGIKSDAELRDADLAASKLIQNVNFGNEPIPIDGEYNDQFMARWKDRLAEASQNGMQHPRRLPERFGGGS